MTREEVIICKMYLEDLDKHHTCNEYKLLMQLLEQEPCDDAISREDALMALTGQCADSLIEILPKAIKRINKLPPVTPTEKVGHWILLDECSNSGYYCSECHKRVVKEGWSDTVKIIKYCPHCGAKMGGEWIPVSEKLPEDYENVLAYDGTDVFVAWYSRVRRKWNSYDRNYDEYTPIIGWMPIPPYKASPTGAESEE